MSDDRTIAIIGAVVLLIGGAFGAIGGHEVTEHYIRQDAIEHNAAEWRVDPKTGKRTFTWLSTKGEREP